MLKSIRALVTRPQPQAASLVKAIRGQQGQAWALPMLEIVPLAVSQAMHQRVLSLAQCRKIIVTSCHAVHFGLPLINRYWPQWPVALDWYAIGPSTAAALQDHGIVARVPSSGNNSEALLAMASLSAVAQEQIMILKGVAGRTHLLDTLRHRGGRVTCLAVYQRRCPTYEKNTLARLLARHRINVILCGSGETVLNLKHCLPATATGRYCLLVPSERVAQQARYVGFNPVITAPSASDNAMLSMLATLQTNAPFI